MRLQAAEWFAEGVTPPEVARRLRVSSNSAYAWRRRWRAGGVAALASKGPGGAVCRLDGGQLAQGSGRVWVAGLVCLKPGARGHLYYRVRVHRGRKGERRSMSEAGYAGLITAAHQELKAPVILIWDRLNTHVSAVMRAFTGAHPGWLTEVRRPAYAPELNAAEGAWAAMKASLGNLAVRDVDQLAAVMKNRLKRIQYRPVLIEAFLAQTGLTFEPQPP